jgi:hypothetical protein
MVCPMEKRVPAQQIVVLHNCRNMLVTDNRNFVGYFTFHLHPFSSHYTGFVLVHNASSYTNVGPKSPNI